MGDLRTYVHAPKRIKPTGGLGPKSIDAVLCIEYSIVSFGARAARIDCSGCGLKEDEHVWGQV